MHEYFQAERRRDLGTLKEKREGEEREREVDGIVEL